MLRCTDLTLALFGHHFNIYCESYNVAVLYFRCKCKCVCLKSLPYITIKIPIKNYLLKCIMTDH